jgi:hypothetical protein
LVYLTVLKQSTTKRNAKGLEEMNHVITNKDRELINRAKKK